jgi:hypothetical protein
MSAANTVIIGTIVSRSRSPEGERRLHASAERTHIPVCVSAALTRR